MQQTKSGFKVTGKCAQAIGSSIPTCPRLRVCPKRGQAPLCEAPFGPFRQRCLTPFRTDSQCPIRNNTFPVLPNACAWVSAL